MTGEAGLGANLSPEVGAGFSDWNCVRKAEGIEDGLGPALPGAFRAAHKIMPGGGQRGANFGRITAERGVYFAVVQSDADFNPMRII